MRIFITTMAFLIVSTTLAYEVPGHELLKTVKIPGDGSWDYLTVDAVNRRVYISHGSQVEVLDADSHKLVGTIPDTKGVHGIAVAADLGRGFISNGKASTATIFDLKTLKKIDEVKTGKNPDAILFDPASKRVFTFNGADKNATAFEAENGKIAGTIPLGGKPEFAAADGKGNVFVNIEDTNEVAKIDTRTLKVLDRWPLAPGETPTGMAMDTRTNRIYSVCRSKHLVILRADTGKVVATLPIGVGTDAAAFDPFTRRIYCSCGDGTVTVVQDDGNDKYSVIETIKTRPRSRTMTLDPQTHTLFLPTAEFKAASKPGERPSMEPNSFGVMIFGAR